MPGDYIAYSRPSAALSSAEIPWTDIFLVHADGSEVGLLATLPRDDWAFSPDANTLAYSTGDRIRLLDLRLGTESPLPGSHWNIGSWSPDGTHLLTSEYGEVNMVSVPSGEAFPITRCIEWAPSIQADCFLPAWSPDGAFISFSAEFAHSGPRDPLAGVYLLDTQCLFDLDACWPNITGPLPFTSGYAWAPDGQTIAFPSNVWAPGEGIGLFSIASYRTIGYVPDPSANSEDIGASIAWSPDGSRIATTWGRIIDLLNGSGVAAFPDTPHARIQWIRIPEVPRPTPGA